MCTTHRLALDSGQKGLGVLELLFVLALGVTLAGIAVPLTTEAVEETRVAAASRNFATRVGGMRIDALKRSTCVGMRFQRATADDYSFELFVDGNANGVRSADISSGIDMRSGGPQRLSDQFPGVAFGLLPGIPDADSQSVPDRRHSYRLREDSYHEPGWQLVVWNAVHTWQAVPVRHSRAWGHWPDPRPLLPSGETAVDKQVKERRRDSRFSERVIAVMRAVLRPGRAVSLINLSAGGALVESQRPLRPGSNVHLQLVADGRTMVCRRERSVARLRRLMPRVSSIEER